MTDTIDLLQKKMRDPNFVNSSARVRIDGLADAVFYFAERGPLSTRDAWDVLTAAVEREFPAGWRALGYADDHAADLDFSVAYAHRQWVMELPSIQR